LWGPTSKRREAGKRKGKGEENKKGGDGTGKKEKGGNPSPTNSNFWLCHCNRVT